MVAMNKGWARDRKGFNEAFRAFAAFWQMHQDAVLFMHSEKFGGGGVGFDLTKLAINAGIPDHAIVWADQYAYRLGVPPRWVAEMYQASDVLLAPSRGEGFGIPVIEAQACGIPCIVSNFSSQPELVADGWLVDGEPYMDFAQSAYWWKPSLAAVIDCLREAYDARTVEPSTKARAHALDYDCDRVWAEHWRPVMKELEQRVPTVAPIKATPA
jgi:glycosyltransferase involved in cell wall biosynthesis